MTEFLVSGKVTLAATDTAQKASPASQPILAASIKCDPDRTDRVHIGPSAVDGNSYFLDPGESLEFDLIDLTSIYLYGPQNAVVYYFGLTP